MSILNLRSKEHTITIDGNDIVLCSPKRKDIIEIETALTGMRDVKEDDVDGLLKLTRTMDDCYARLLVCSSEEIRNLEEDEQLEVAHEIITATGGHHGDLMNNVVQLAGSMIVQRIHLAGKEIESDDIDKIMKEKEALDPVTENTFQAGKGNE